MENMMLKDIIERATNIREAYHALEVQHHGSKWSVEEDALAFLTDAGIVGRLVMSQQGRWPTDGNDESELKRKMAECIWWILCLGDRTNLDMVEAMEEFLGELETKFIK